MAKTSNYDQETILFPPTYDLTSDQMLGKLPIRGEKRLIPVVLPQKVTDRDTANTYDAESAARKTLTDYITIRIANCAELNGENFVYRFLINPKSVSVAHQTLDAHSMARGGWQLGVWGEDTIDLHITGSTAGQYYASGLSDELEEFTVSYRNSMELMNIFENNGYTFEGGLSNKGWGASDSARKRIKYHQDVELRVGNFIWKGMFTSMNFNTAADTPYLNTFDLGFLAWKEEYTVNSPWRSPNPYNVYRGHSQELLDAVKRSKAKADKIRETETFRRVMDASDEEKGSDF